MFSKISRALFIVVLAAGCGNFNQDPLKDYPDNIRNGVPPSEVQTKPDRSPLCKECYRFDVDDIVEMSEGQPLSVEIGARVFVPIKSLDIQIDNLSDFPGAKFTEIAPVAPTPMAKKYKFTWTPPIGFTGADVMKVSTLNLKMNVNSLQMTGETKAVKILVNRTSKVPSILQANFDKTSVNEAEVSTLKLLVQDQDSTDFDPPRVQFTSTLSASDANVFLTFKSVLRDASTNNWIITYEFNTKDNDVTDSQRYFEANLMVLSRYGTKSQTRNVSINVTNNLKEALSSIANGANYTFTKGVRNVTSFTIFDPTMDGDVSAVLRPVTTSIPGVYNLTCTKPVPMNKYYSNCEFVWEIPLSSVLVSPYTFNIEIRNSGMNGFSLVTKTSVSTFRVNVVTPSTPTTTLALIPGGNN